MKLRMILAMVFVINLLIVPARDSRCEDSKYLFGELTSMANKYGSDKGSKIGQANLYTEVYEYYFYPIKYGARKIFEIGIASGSSLKMWKDYFPNAVIYGIDIEDNPFPGSEAMKTFIADQSKRSDLKAFIDKYGDDYDVIIDDGGHAMDQQQISFGYLFKYVKAGGYYIIEDLHTSLFSDNRFGARLSGENTTLAMVEKFMHSGTIQSMYMTPEESAYAAANIEYCNLFSRHQGRSMMCIFKKKHAPIAH